MSVQYRVEVAKADVRVSGPDDADVVFTAPSKVVSDPGFDAAIEFMRGSLKASGDAGEVLDLLRSGAVTTELVALAEHA